MSQSLVAEAAKHFASPETQKIIEQVINVLGPAATAIEFAICALMAYGASKVIQGAIKYFCKRN
jgi:hypothetical protein